MSDYTTCTEPCTLPEGHPGYHLAEDGRQWVGGPMNRDGSRPKAAA